MRTVCAALAGAVGLLCAASAGAAEDVSSAAAAAGHELAAGFLAAPERAWITTLSAPPLAETGAGAAGLGAAAAQAIAARITAETKLALVDRQKAAAQAVLAGSLTDSGGTLTLAARIVQVSNGKVLASAQRQVGAARAAGAVESQSIEVAMRRLADGLAAGFDKLPGSSRYRRLAVMTFSDVGAEAEKRRIGTIVTAELATDLRRDHGLLLVERARLAEVMGEIKLGQSGAVDAATAPEIGKLADAQALVIGTAADLGDRYRIDARIIATESGETLAAASASVAAAGMVALSSDAVVLRSRKDAAFRSVLIPGWGQIYNRQPVKGGLILTAELGLIAGGVAFHLLGQHAYSQYTSQTSAGQLGSNPSAQAQSLYDTAVSRYQTRNVLFIVAGGLWAANILDAYLSGVDGDSLLSGGLAQRRRMPGELAFRF